MSNAHIHPIILDRLAPFSALPKAHRVFAVKINLGGELRELNILAASWHAAWSQAADLLDLPDDLPADGIAFSCKPAAVQP